jgi:hypothetical protein
LTSRLKERDMANVTGFINTYLEDAEVPDIAAVLRFALPVRQTHVNAPWEHSLRLVADEDPSQPA